MPFVKLDCGILNSTLWFEREAREIFITALLLAEPREFDEPVAEIATDSLSYTGWSAPAGWYGFVPAASSGIVRRSMLADEEGMAGIRKLAAADPSSRSPEYDGRRMIRINGGFLILNYQKYREKDHTAAERSRRYRERKANRHAVMSMNHTVTPRSATQAEAEAEAEAEVEKKNTGGDNGGGSLRSRPPRSRLKPFAKPELAEVQAHIDRMGYQIDPVAFLGYYEANGWKVGKNPMRNWKAALTTWQRRRLEA